MNISEREYIKMIAYNIKSNTSLPVSNIRYIQGKSFYDLIEAGYLYRKILNS